MRQIGAEFAHERENDRVRPGGELRAGADFLLTAADIDSLGQFPNRLQDHLNLGKA
jgi:hypothetical protein